MPVYAYECPLGHTFDDLQPMPGQALKKCPSCGKMELAGDSRGGVYPEGGRVGAGRVRVA